jgi:hypothetical protein
MPVSLEAVEAESVLALLTEAVLVAVAAACWRVLSILMPITTAGTLKDVLVVDPPHLLPHPGQNCHLLDKFALQLEHIFSLRLDEFFRSRLEERV